MMAAGLLLSVNAAADPVFRPAEGTITDAQAFGDGAIELLEFDRNGTDVKEWAVYIGTSQGAWDLQRITHMNRYEYTTTPEPDVESLFIGIPADGSTFYMRFWWLDRAASDWQYVDKEYIAPDLN